MGMSEGLGGEHCELRSLSTAGKNDNCIKE